MDLTMPNPNNPAEIAGVDFSGTRPDPGRVGALGLRFGISYLKPLTSSGPNEYEWRREEIGRWVAAGLGVLAVWETDGVSGPLGGAPYGQRDGMAAVSRAQAVGYPAGAPIFAAADFDVSDAQLPMVVSYFQGFHDATAAHGWPGGAYGSIKVVDACAAAGIPYLWQTAGWSNGDLSQHAHLYQRSSPVWPVVPGTDEDVLCRPLPWVGGGGGAPLSSPSPPAVAPGPVPSTFDVMSWTANLGDAGAIFQHLQDWANETFPAYCAIAPTAPNYGPQTAAFLRAFAQRAAGDAGLPAWVRGRLASADGANVGQGLAYALDHYGLTAYLARVGFRG